MRGLTVISLPLTLLVLVSANSQWTTSQNKSRVSEAKRNQCSNESMCPTWFTCDSDNRCQCEKSDNDGIICNNENLFSAILVCHCVTYDEESGSTYTGPCFYNCEHFNAPNVGGDEREVYDILPQDPEKLINHSACAHFHRTGLLCGDCEEGHSPLVLSYNLSCVPCPDGRRNWWKFVLAGFIPVTLFYLFIVLFNINVTSSRLHGFVWVSQMGSMPAFIRIVFLNLEVHGNQLAVGKIFATLYSYWNLDFFRSVLPNICLNVTTLEALALEYLIALYPFVLIISSYLILILYDRKFRFLVYVWSPFKMLQTKLQRLWDIRTSIIDSFSTFFLLSYVKVLSVTCDILIPVQIQKLGSSERHLALYYSPSVTYFGDYHLPYAIFAASILVIFVIVPTAVFILYPCQFFHKFLSLFPINWHFLHAFVDSFQGSYKNGTEPGTFDCRWFSVITLIVKPLLFIIFGSTLSSMYFVYAVAVFALLMILLINFQPYKKTSSNYPPTDLMFLFLFSLVYIAILGRDHSSSEMYQYFYRMWIAVSLILGFIPAVYACVLVGLWLFSRRKWIICKT